MIVLAEVLNVHFVVVTSSPAPSGYIGYITPPPAPTPLATPATSVPSTPVPPSSADNGTATVTNSHTDSSAGTATAIVTSSPCSIPSTTTPTPALEQEPSSATPSTSKHLEPADNSTPSAPSASTCDSGAANTIAATNASSVLFSAATHEPTFVRLVNECLWHYNAATISEVRHPYLLLVIIVIDFFSSNTGVQG